MTRTNRIALLGAIALLVALAGTTFALRAPVADGPTPQLADDPEAPPDPEAIDRAVERLAANEIDASADLLTELATEHGLGGAVRIVAWADELEGEATVDDIAERRAAGEGWGQIAKALGVHPGIGSIMGNGGGHGRDAAPGQQKDPADDD
jgi:hypothetical protein